VYDPQKDIWVTKTSMPTGRAWIRACCLNDKFYCFGGFGNGRHQVSVEEYNPETDTWLRKTQAPHQVPIQYAKNIKGNIYTISSAGFRGTKSFLDQYDPVSDKWISLATPVQSSFFDFASLESESDIFIISGFQFDPNNVIKTVQRYNISQNKWDRLPDLLYGRVALGAQLLDNSIYVLGGQFGWYTNPIKYTDVVEKLDLDKLFNKNDQGK
jgi:N-acetylneuraminic acid mutarotase